jgi:predicted membrane-bound mannosyltransferase
MYRIKARGFARSWWSAAVSMLSIGAMLRIFRLGLKPLHADEGVNGLFLLDLFREGIYRYNPANYLGPRLYYSVLISSSLNHLLSGSEDPTTLAIRMVPVAFGIALSLLLIFRDTYETSEVSPLPDWHFLQAWCTCLATSSTKRCLEFLPTDKRVFYDQVTGVKVCFFL